MKRYYCPRCGKKAAQDGYACPKCFLKDRKRIRKAAEALVGGTSCPPEAEAALDPVGPRGFLLYGDPNKEVIGHGLPAERKTPPSVRETDADGPAENALRAWEDGAVE